MQTLSSTKVPTVNQYITAFRAINNLTDTHLKILQTHYHAYEKTITAKQLAQAMGYKHYGAANMIYGRLAGLVGELLDYNSGPDKLGTLVTFEKRNKEWHWILRPEVSEALEILGWIANSTKELSNQSIYSTIFNELVYVKDDRSPPDNRRMAQFKIWWENATSQRREYTDEKLAKVLTWNNLGYRFGLKLGNVSESEINEAYEFLSQEYWSSLNVMIFPEEVNAEETFREGAVRQVSVNAYERDLKARQKCINYYGSDCSACGFNFGKSFGQLGEGFIHVHHLRPISEIAEEYNVDPIKDLRPVCPNCHAMIHRRSPPFSIEEIKVLLEATK